MNGMNSGLLLDEMPLWLLFVLTLGFIAICWGAGFQWARRSHRAGVAGEEAFSSEIMGALLGLLAFVLALTVDMAADRFADRQDLAQEEVETIRSAFLGAGHANPPERDALRAALRSYVALRLEPIAEVSQLADMERRSREVHAELVRLGERVGAGAGVTDVHASVVANLQDVVTLHHRRLALGLRSRTPPSVIWTMLTVMAIAMFGVGWRAGEKEGRRYMSLAAFALSFSLVMVLISWLDRPNNRLLQDNQQMMRGLQEWMEGQPGTGEPIAS